MNNYENLRVSFDNILKELDDICKNIDNISEIDRNFYSNQEKDVNNSNRLEIKNHAYNYQRAQLDLDERSSLNSNNSTRIYSSPSNNVRNDNYDHGENQGNRFVRNNRYENYKNSFKNVDAKQIRQNERFKMNGKQHSQDSYSIDEIDNNSLLEREKPILNIFRKHQLPDDNASLNSIIGSAQETVFQFDRNKYSFPMATNSNSNFYTQTSKNNSNGINNNHNYDCIHHKGKNRLNQVNFSNTKFVENSNGVHETEYLADADYDQEPVSYETKSIYSYPNESHFDDYKQSLLKNDDYLSSYEIEKIRCFYNSVDCYVYVSTCVAELYQIKREDEFDSVDNDPVHDYYIFLQNKNKENEFTSKENKSIVNYMYIKSGVPVIIFNYGNNGKRRKDLRILLAERSTGFCMWEFKFDKLNEYENVYSDMSISRLSQSDQIKYENNVSLYSNPANSSTINYQNEYFEKYFNSKYRHAYKEHLLKFVLKDGCDQFNYELNKIMTDKYNSNMFYVNHFNFQLDSEHKQNSLNSLNMVRNSTKDANFSSSVILCHFDFLIYDQLNNLNNSNTYRKAHSSQTSLNTNGFSAIDQKAEPKNYHFDTQSLSSMRARPAHLESQTNSAKFSTLTRKHSNSVSNMIPNSLRKIKTMLNRNMSSSYNQKEQQEKNMQKSANLSNRNSSHFGKDPSILNLNDLSNVNSNSFKQFLVKYRRFSKSDISSPVNFNHVTHLDKPVPIGKRYKFKY